MELVDKVRLLLPSHYFCYRRLDNEICCESREGIESDKDWEYFKVTLKHIIGDRFSEIYHVTCTNHKYFVIYLKKEKNEDNN